jgi:predicted amidophosphoribosyltransferase
MDPFTLYFLLVAAALVICAFAVQLAPRPSRACPNCEGDVAQNAKACRACGYRFRAEV